jgi:hypothetical protein
MLHSEARKRVQNGVDNLHLTVIEKKGERRSQINQRVFEVQQSIMSALAGVL